MPIFEDGIFETDGFLGGAVASTVVQTTDASNEDVLPIPIAVGKTVQVIAYTVARLSTGLKNQSYQLQALFRRNTGGDVTLVGAAVTTMDQHDTAGTTWTAQLVAKTSNQTITLRLNGAASETVNWNAAVFYREIT